MNTPEELKTDKSAELLALAQETRRTLEMRFNNRNGYNIKLWEKKLLKLAYDALDTPKLERRFGLDR